MKHFTDWLKNKMESIDFVNSIKDVTNMNTTSEHIDQIIKDYVKFGRWHNGPHLPIEIVKNIWMDGYKRAGWQGKESTAVWNHINQMADLYITQPTGSGRWRDSVQSPAEIVKNIWMDGYKFGVVN